MRGQGQPVYVTAIGHSDLGLVRENNEDSFLVADLTGGNERASSSALDYLVGGKRSLFLVADGMGGAEAGEIASHMAAELVSQYLKGGKFLNRRSFVRALKKSIQRANSAIYHEGQKNAKRKGMGTTLTAAGVYDDAVFFAQVGDSRGYLVRSGSIAQMTRDQSLIAHLVATGKLTADEAKSHPQRNVILQALGVQKKVDAVVSYAELRKGDWVLLCSDGLSGKVEPDEMGAVLTSCSEPKEACQQLIGMARDRGGEDNITVIVARFDGEKLPLPSPDEAPAYTEFKEESPRFWPWGRR